MARSVYFNGLEVVWPGNNEIVAVCWPARVVGYERYFEERPDGSRVSVHAEIIERVSPPYIDMVALTDDEEDAILTELPLIEATAEYARQIARELQLAAGYMEGFTEADFDEFEDGLEDDE